MVVGHNSNHEAVRLLPSESIVKVTGYDFKEGHDYRGRWHGHSMSFTTNTGNTHMLVGWASEGDRDSGVAFTADAGRYVSGLVWGNNKLQKGDNRLTGILTAPFGALMCSAEQHCSNHGTAFGNTVEGCECTCEDGWGGDDCSCSPQSASCLGAFVISGVAYSGVGGVTFALPDGQRLVYGSATNPDNNVGHYSNKLVARLRPSEHLVQVTRYEFAEGHNNAGCCYGGHSISFTTNTGNIYVLKGWSGDADRGKVVTVTADAGNSIVGLSFDDQKQLVGIVSAAVSATSITSTTTSVSSTITSVSSTTTSLSSIITTLTSSTATSVTSTTTTVSSTTSSETSTSTTTSVSSTITSVSSTTTSVSSTTTTLTSSTATSVTSTTTTVSSTTSTTETRTTTRLATSTTMLSFEGGFTPSDAVSARSTAEQQYLSTAKGLYVWNPGTTAGTKWWAWNDNGNTPRLVSFCNAHNFTRAIIFIGSVEWDWETNYKKQRLPQEAHFVTVFRALRAANIEPSAAFYLNDLPNSMVGVDKTADVVRTIAAFNKAHPDAVIAGLEGDQEPNVVGGEYERMGKLMRQTRDSLDIHLEIGAALRPKWLNQAPDFRDALDSLDTGMLMAYSSLQSGSEAMAKRALVHANDVEKPLSIAIEVANMDGKWTDSEKETFYSMVNMPDKDPFFAMVAAMDATYSADIYYVDMVIHAYDHYFNLLFGVQPDDFGSDSVDGRLFAGDVTPAPTTATTTSSSTTSITTIATVTTTTTVTTTSMTAAPSTHPTCTTKDKHSDPLHRCVFPFRYNNQLFTSCIADGLDPDE
eukprot:gene24483-3915_t